MKPSCHIDLDQTMGYSSADPLCPNCIHKVSCLLGAIDVGNVRDSVEDLDSEVEAVRRRSMSMDEVKERIVHRQSFVDRGKAVPGPLRHDAFIAPVRRKVKRAKGPGPKRVPPRPKPVPKPKPKKEPKPKRIVNLEGPSRHYKSGRAFPSRRMAVPEEFEKILAETNRVARQGPKGPRFPFDLDVGMELVLHRPEGDLVVEITPNGFAWNGELFTSISTAWCHAMHRSVSGFDLFDVNKNRDCTIRGLGVPGGAYSYRDRTLKPERKRRKDAKKK